MEVERADKVLYTFSVVFIHKILKNTDTLASQKGDNEIW